jgi:hypothetical protein
MQYGAVFWTTTQETAAREVEEKVSAMGRGVGEKQHSMHPFLAPSLVAATARQSHNNYSKIWPSTVASYVYSRHVSPESPWGSDERDFA